MGCGGFLLLGEGVARRLDDGAELVVFHLLERVDLDLVGREHHDELQIAPRLIDTKRSDDILAMRGEILLKRSDEFDAELGRGIEFACATASPSVVAGDPHVLSAPSCATLAASAASANAAASAASSAAASSSSSGSARTLAWR